MKTILVVAAVCATLLAAAASYAATTHWVLAKRVTGINKSKNVSATLHNVRGIAVSLHMPQRLGVAVEVSGTCTRNGKRLPVGITGFTSYGLGAKVPLKLPYGSPSTCTILVSISRPVTVVGSNPTTLSIWRR